MILYVFYDNINIALSNDLTKFEIPYGVEMVKLIKITNYQTVNIIVPNSIIYAGGIMTFGLLLFQTFVTI